MASETCGTLICAGYLNILLNSRLDTTGKKRKKSSSEIQVNNMLRDLGLIDVWRNLNRSDLDFTFYSARHNIHSRIDYFLMFSNDRHRIRDCRIGQRDLSDHSGLYLKLHLDCAPKKTVWRLNTGMLNSVAFRATMGGELKEFLEHNDNGEVSPAILWDAAKAFLRGRIITQTAFLKKLKSKQLLELEVKLRDLERLHGSSWLKTLLPSHK